MMGPTNPSRARLPKLGGAAIVEAATTTSTPAASNAAARRSRALRAVDEPGGRDLEAGLPKPVGEPGRVLRPEMARKSAREALLEEREVGRQQPDPDRPGEAPAD